MTSHRIPTKEMLTAFGEPLSIITEGGRAEQYLGIVYRSVLVTEGNLQYYGTLLDVASDVDIAPKYTVIAGGAYYEVTQVYEANDPNWIRSVIVARREP